MTVGLSQFRDARVADRLHWMLLLPFVGRPGDYPITRHCAADAQPQVNEAVDACALGPAPSPR
jgi:hypothetical protein